MNDLTKVITIGFLGLVTVWDAFTTVTGTLSVVSTQNGTFALILSVLCAIFVGGMLINTIPVMTNPRDDIMTVAAKWMWGICFLYDVYTAFMGNQSLLLVQNISGMVMLGFMTIITVACPVTISYILFKR